MPTSDKKYYWIKLKEDFFNLETIDWLSSQQNGCEYIVLYQKLLLLTANHNGELASKIGEMIIPYSCEKIARDTKFKIDTVVVALELFKKLGLVFEQGDGVLKLPYLKDVVGSSSDNSNAKRIARWRREKALQQPLQQPLQNVTERLEIEIRDRDRDKEIDKDIEKDTYIETISSTINTYTTNKQIISLLREFVELRQKKKKPLTVRAIKMALNALDKLAGNDDSKKEAIINQTILHAWDSFYQLKEEPKTNLSHEEFIAQTAARILAKQKAEKERRLNGCCQNL